jgi:hypothetical protein
MVNERWTMAFAYGSRGYGELILRDKGNMIYQWWARSGSTNQAGQLVNVISPQEWYLCSGPETPVASEAWVMTVHGKLGSPWKQRLWPIPTYSGHEPISRFLIHPDGGKPGTAGCIGLQNTNGMELHWFLKWFFDAPESITGGKIIRLSVSQTGEQEGAGNG